MMSFMFIHNNVDYHIKPDVAANIQSFDASRKTLTYGGTATLYKYGGGPGSTPGSETWIPTGQPFPMPLTIKYERYFVTQ